MKCEICGNEAGNRTHQVREMMLGLRDSFTYIECAGCGCLFLREIPPNLSTYYPPDYLSWRELHSSRVKQILRKLHHRAHLRNTPVVSKLIPASPRRPDIQAVSKIRPRKSARILDVGCGAGLLVRDLRIVGI